MSHGNGSLPPRILPQNELTAVAHRMNSPEGNAALVQGLECGIADRVRRESEIAALMAQVDYQAAWRFQSDKQSLILGHQQWLDQRQAQLQSELQSLEEQSEIDQRKLSEEFRLAEQTAKAETAAELVRVETQFKENAWLLESITDDTSADNPLAQPERLKLQFTQSQDSWQTQRIELERVYNETVKVVTDRRGRVPEVPVVVTPVHAIDDPSEQFAALIQEVVHHSQVIANLIIPRAFYRKTPIVLTCIVFAFSFAAGWYLVDPHWLNLTFGPGLEWGAISAGFALVFCLVFWLCLSLSATQVTTEPLEKLQAAYAQAIALHTDLIANATRRQKQAEQEAAASLQSREELSRRRLAKFEQDRDQAIANCHHCSSQRLSSLIAQRDHASRQAAERYNNSVLAAEGSYRREVALAQRQHDNRLLEMQQQFAASNQATADHLAELQRQCCESWWTTVRNLEREAARRKADARRELVDLGDVARPGWHPSGTLPLCGIEIGSYRIDLEKFPDGKPVDQELALSVQPTSWPALWQFPGGSGLLIKSPGKSVDQGIELVRSLMIRAMAQLPAGSIRFTIFDPIGLGENFAAFMNLADFDDLLITNRIWTETTQFDEQLAKLTEHMETVFQKYLRNEFATIEEYNQQAGEVAEPYRVLVIAGFPAGLSERALQRLQSVVSKGTRCGVSTLIVYDSTAPRPHGFDLGSFEQHLSILEIVEGRFVDRQLGVSPIEVVPASALPTSELLTLIRKLGEFSKDVRRVEVPFQRIVPARDHYWKEDSRSQIRVPLGRAGATRLQYMQLGKGTSQHVLIAGKTGSGKSTLLNVVITDLALRYSPDDLQFYLIDFKKGVEFKAYATHQLPHARVIAIESDREFGVSVLERLDQELRERGELFRAQGVQDVAAYRNAVPNHPMPRVLLMVDEFQEFFVEDDRYSQTASLLLDRLVRQGRAFGIHVILGSQTLGGAYTLPRTTIGQMAVRIALQCSEADAHLILSEENTAARLLTRPGEALYNDANGMIEGNSPFQVAWLDDAQRDEYLERVADLAHSRNRIPTEQIVFEGNVPANSLRVSGWVQAVTQYEGSNSQGVDAQATSIWLGESVAIKGAEVIEFEPRSGCNLLLVGPDSQMSSGILANAAAVLVARTKRNPGMRVQILAGDLQGGISPRWSRIENCLQTSCVAGIDQVGDVLAQFTQEMDRRSSGAVHSGPETAWFLIIDDLVRFRDLRKSDDDYGFGGFDKTAPATPSRLLGTLLKEGPAVGLHVIVWADVYNTLDRSLGRQLIREFDTRVLFPMGPADSSQLIDSPAASRLGVNRAILYFDELGESEKFRPFGPPNDEWFAFIQGEPTENGQSLDIADDINAFSIS